MKLWGGRFSKPVDKLVNDFNASITFDKRLYKQDIKGSIAHVLMLGKQGIITLDEADLLKSTLEEILKDFESGELEFDLETEDIHSNIEKIVISRIGETGKKIHTGRSRNDQVALDFRMYVKDEIDYIKALVKNVMMQLLTQSKEHTDTILPGYTHLQRAQPITLAHHLMAYFEMFKRDYARLEDVYKRTNICPLGSGALAATVWDLDRYATAEALGFDDVTYNSLDGVSDRDFCIELLGALSIIMMHLSRFCEELILWSSLEFNFIELDDAYSTGSSLMPQKKNPDVPELIRGKTGRVYGSLIGLLTTMKSLPLAYNKDMQEDKEPVFDAADTVKACLEILPSLIKTMKIKKENMYKAASGGFTNATDVADYLVGRGVAFRDAHEIVGKLVVHCIDVNESLESLALSEYQNISPVFEQGVYSAISLEECVSKRNVIGGPSKVMMEQVIAKREQFLNEL